MLLRQPDVVAPRSHKKAESLRPSATLSCISTCRQSPFTFHYPFLIYFVCLRVQQSGHLKHDILMPYPAALSHDCLKYR